MVIDEYTIGFWASSELKAEFKKFAKKNLKSRHAMIKRFCREGLNKKYSIERIVVKRKLVIAGGSLFICLPKYWGEYHSLNKGDNIGFEIQKDNNLILMPKADDVLMKRKLIKRIGSIFISLPNYWCKYHSLNNGDNIGLQIQKNRNLILMPKADKMAFHDFFMTFKIPLKLRTELKEFAKKNGYNTTDIIRKFCIEGMKNGNKKRIDNYE